MLQPESSDPLTGEVSTARYTTHEMLTLESGMAQAAGRMQVSYRHRVEAGHIAGTIAAIQASTGEASAELRAGRLFATAAAGCLLAGIDSSRSRVERSAQAA